MKFNYEELQTLEKFASLEWAKNYEIGDLFIKKDEKEIIKIEEGISVNTLMTLWAIIYYEKNKPIDNSKKL